MKCSSSDFFVSALLLIAIGGLIISGTYRRGVKDGRAQFSHELVDELNKRGINLFDEKGEALNALPVKP